MITTTREYHISRLEVWEVNGQLFRSREQAINHVEDQLNRLLTKALVGRGLGVRECIRLTEALLANRHEFGALLTYTTDRDE